MGIVFSKVLLTPILRLGKGIKTMKKKNSYVWEAQSSGIKKKIFNWIRCCLIVVMTKKVTWEQSGEINEKIR